MLTRQKAALVFFALAGSGAALIALVWRMKGNWGFILMVLGCLLIIAALKWLERAFRVWDEEKKAAKREEEELYWGVQGHLSPSEPFVPQQNLPLRKKLSWWFGGIAVSSGLATALGTQMDKEDWLLFSTFPIALWSLFVWAGVRDSVKPENPKHDFAYVWGSSPVFRRNNLLFGFVMWAVVFLGATLSPPPPNAAPYVIGIFCSLFVILLAYIFYIRLALEKGVPGLWDGWSVGQKRLSYFLDGLTIVLFILGFAVLKRVMPNLIQELYFSLLFAVAGLAVGYLAHDFLKNRHTGFFDDEEKKSQMLLQVYICCLILTLCTAALASRQMAFYRTETKAYRVADKSETYKKKHYLWLEVSGKRKRFEPKLAEWEAAQPGDSIQVLIGRGLLGFEHILQFGTPR